MDFDVKLKSNGDYWKAWWNAPGGIRSKSIGAKAKYSRRQATALCRQMAVDLRLGRIQDARAVPKLSEWLAKYPTLRTGIAGSTRGLIEHTGRYLLEFFDNDPPIGAITRIDAAEWRGALSRGELAGANKFPKPAANTAPETRHHRYRKALDARTKKGPKPLSDATVAKHVRCAKRIFAEAAEQDGLGLIGRNPFNRLPGKAPKANKDWRQVSQGDLVRILDSCPNNGWRALFALCRLAGLRRGEALRLEWSDLDWAGNRMVVNAREPETTKKRIRTLPIEPARCPTGLTAKLHEWLGSAPEGSSLVCQGVGANNLDKNARAIIRRSGVGSYRKPFHALRKNRAVEIAAQYPQHILCEWMGHGAEVSQEFYLRVDAELYVAPEVAHSLDQISVNKADSTV